MQTRLATPHDADAIALIYNQGIEDRFATFETRPRSADGIDYAQSLRLEPDPTTPGAVIAEEEAELPRKEPEEIK